MKFSITDLLLTTTAYAALLGLEQTFYDGFKVTFSLLVFMQLFCPFAIVFTTIAFADQRGQMLDVSTNRAYKVLKKVWLLSLICTGLLVSTMWLISYYEYFKLVLTIYERSKTPR